MLASIIGGLTSLIIFCENIGVIYSLFYKIFFSSLMVLVAFLPKNIKVFVKTYLSFFLISFLFGGCVYALEIALNPQNMLYYNGVIYFDMSISYLVGCILSVYGVFLITEYVISRKHTKSSECIIEIKYNKTAVTIPAFIDTGNTLVDGFNARPVIVAELSAVAPIFQREELLFFKTQSLENIPSTLYKRFHFVPCSAVTGESLLPSFLPDSVKILTSAGSFQTDFCTIAVVDKKFTQGEYKAILNNNIFENMKEEKKYEKFYI